MKVHEVFGISPTISEYSYIDRGALDDYFKKLLDRKQTHIAIRGASKVGKSWLRQKVLINPIIVQCRNAYTVTDIYRDVLSALDISVKVETTTSSERKGTVDGAGELGFTLLAKISGRFSVEGSRATEVVERTIGKDINDINFLTALIKASGRILVIEDFHYLSIPEQRKFAFDLKLFWDVACFVVVIGVWINENMLITLNSDLSDRIEEINVTWSTSELKCVLQKGCNELNIRLSNGVQAELANISYGSVGLLQKLALRYIEDECGVIHSTDEGTEILLDNQTKVHDAAMHTAEQLNQLYISFARRVSNGIRERKNSTGIYAHAMKAIIEASDEKLQTGLSAKEIHSAAHSRQPRIQLGNLKTILEKFTDLQIDSDGRGLVVAYDPEDEKVSVVDKQLLLYRRFSTLRWPWEEIIDEVGDQEDVFDA